MILSSVLIIRPLYADWCKQTTNVMICCITMNIIAVIISVIWSCQSSLEEDVQCIFFLSKFSQPLGHIFLYIFVVLPGVIYACMIIKLYNIAKRQVVQVSITSSEMETKIKKKYLIYVLNVVIMYVTIVTVILLNFSDIISDTIISNIFLFLYAFGNFGSILNFIGNDSLRKASFTILHTYDCINKFNCY